MHKALTWLLYGRTGNPVDPSAGRIDPARLDAASRLMKALAETITGLLRVAQEQAMSIPSLQPALFREELRKIAKRHEQPLSAQEEESLRKQSVRLIAGQREQESEYIRAREQELQTIIAMVGREIEGSAAENQEFATQMQAALADLGRAVEIDDLRSVRERIHRHVGLVTQRIEAKRQCEHERIRSLEEQVEVLTHKVTLTPQASHTDLLTTLYSREAFDKQIRTEVSLAHRLRRPLSLVLIDIDQFKLANETYGKDAADDVLVRLAGRIIREFFRKTDFIARFGNDEFAVLLTQEQLDVARRAAEGLGRGLTQRPIPTRAGEVTITISAGVVEYAPVESWEQLLARAGEALRQARQDGGNRVVAAPSPAQQRAA